MNDTDFDAFADKLEKNVYGSLKGKIRLTLLLRDILDFCPEFSSRKLTILDVGGGGGQFASLCLKRGHNVLLCDSSREMLGRAEKELREFVLQGRVKLVCHDFLAEAFCPPDEFDVVLLHGSAEWMSDTAAAIQKAGELVASGGILSLLIFNKDKHAFKLGINGRLLTGSPSKKKKLIPPGAMTTAEAKALLQELGWSVLLHSGIRIFHNFFRQIDQQVISPEEWLEQERTYYRKIPFSMMGEHSHFLCRFTGDSGC